MSLSSSSSSSDYSVFLVDKKFKKDKLDKNDLEDLVGLHFVSEPNYDELKALHEKGVKVNSQSVYIRISMVVW